eukprot:CAMPEP_0185690156 /NCGR_PEP_ID=MMETSP1164-20130828/941_1 /TAXON_ID=1104430 /ORGANISM="Chrysoreinhardia sp, Strain CCMP2950" /LENGTH=366 /DNA_ID=CAMNT_0028356711 /DNA_START=26 /DNA_END=1124 /DNA_ORIENTATION=+
MGERKVLNRYFPPDFDPSLVPKKKWDPYKQVEVRMMIPFSMQCLKCGEFMYRGKKFNSRKEDVIGDDYLGVKKYRFYIKCSVCSNEIAFKTDPENQDYVCESGASRNFESWRQQESAEASFEKERRDETEGSAMAALESRTLDSKMEMDILDALDEIKALNERSAGVRARLEAGDTRDVLSSSADRRGQLTPAERSELDAFRKAQAAAESPSAAGSDARDAPEKKKKKSGPSIRRAPPLDDDDDDDDASDDDEDDDVVVKGARGSAPQPPGGPPPEEPNKQPRKLIPAAGASKRGGLLGSSPFDVGALKRRRLAPSPASPAASAVAPPPGPAAPTVVAAPPVPAAETGLGGLAGYGTSSGNSDDGP